MSWYYVPRDTPGDISWDHVKSWGACAKLMPRGACENATSGCEGAFGSVLAFVVWERKCSRGTIILAFRRGCGNTQSLLRDLSEYMCLFTMMNDWLRSELKSFFFWRWYENPAQNFLQSAARAQWLRNKVHVYWNASLLGTRVAAKPLHPCPKFCVEGTQGCMWWQWYHCWCQETKLSSLSPLSPLFLSKNT